MFKLESSSECYMCPAILYIIYTAGSSKVQFPIIITSCNIVSTLNTSYAYSGAPMLCMQWNPSIAATLGQQYGCCTGVAFIERFGIIVHEKSLSIQKI